MNKKGFTLVELLAVIVVIGILAISAATAVSSIMQKQKNNAKELTLKSVDEAAVSYFVNTKRLYMPACQTSSGVYITSKDIKTSAISSISLSNVHDSTTVNALFPSLRPSNNHCYNAIDVKTLVDKGLLDDNGNCKKDGKILVYQEGSTDNPEGELIAIHEKEVCF